MAERIVPNLKLCKLTASKVMITPPWLTTMVVFVCAVAPLPPPPLLDVAGTVVHPRSTPPTRASMPWIGEPPVVDSAVIQDFSPHRIVNMLTSSNSLGAPPAPPGDAFAAMPVSRDGHGVLVGKSSKPGEVGWLKKVTARAAAKAAKCPPGRYAKTLRGRGATSELCVACAAGKYQTTSGYTWYRICSTCPPGKFGVGGGSFCTLCYAGRFNPHQGQTDCRLCTAGQVSKHAGELHCAECSGGAVPAQDHASCRCKAGHIIRDQRCARCPAGRAPTEAGDACAVMCPSGTFTRKNSVRTRSGVPKCVPCPSGRAQPKSGQEACHACDTGRFAKDAGLGSCRACAAGQWSRIRGAAVCSWCPKGTYQPLPGRSSCIWCPPGKYNEFDLGIRCVGCPGGVPGKFLAKAQDATRNSCRFCPYGKWQRQSGQVACTMRPRSPPPSPAPTPSYWANPTPKPSPAPTLKPWIFRCSSGKFKPNPTCGDCRCQLCPTGRFQLRGGQCLACPRGKHQAKRGATACKVCAAGMYQFGTGQTRCNASHESVAPTPVQVPHSTPPSPPPTVGWIQALKACPLGKFRPGAQVDGMAPGKRVRCRPCPPGKWQGQERESSTGTSCRWCPKGKFQPMPGNVDCFQCPKGRFSDSAGRNLCMLCPLGRFANRIGQSVCAAMHLVDALLLPIVTKQAQLACPNGKYEHASSYSNTTRTHLLFTTMQHTCASCPRGKYRNVAESALAACVPCVGGQYQNRASAKECKTCPRGKFTGYATTGASACSTSCPAGSFEQGQQCQPCAPGTFHTRAAAVSAKCPACPAGKFQADFGQSSCRSCPAGKYQLFVRQSSCMHVLSHCRPGKYGVSQAFDGKIFSRCRSCPHGMFQRHHSKLKCAMCPPGKFQRRTQQPFCDECPQGKFQHARKQGKCLACRAGQFQDNYGKSSCVACPRGKYQELAGQSRCFVEDGKKQLPQHVPCARGRYRHPGAHSARAAHCADCPAGWFSKSAGAVTCVRCPAGKFQANRGFYFCFDWLGKSHKPGLDTAVSRKP